MPRWMWVVPFGVLVLLAGVLSLRLGIQHAAISETEVIDHYAARYLADHRREIGTDAALTDCIARPGDMPGVWVEVRCSPADGSPDFVYGADSRGAELFSGRDGEAPAT